LASVRKDKAKAAAEAYLSAVTSGTSWDTAAAEAGVEVKETVFFKRNAAIPDIGFNQAISDAAFSLNEENVLHDGILEAGGNYYIIRFKAEHHPDDAQFEKEKKTLISGLLQQRRSAAFQELLRQLKETAEIDISEGFNKRS
jgi:hypothetical protein